MSLDAVFKHIDECKDVYIQRLADAVAIQSVSADDKKRDECVKMVSWTENLLRKIGATTEIVPLSVEGHNDPPLPPVLLGVLGNDPNKKTLVVYGHLDVQPAKKSDGWSTDPFVLTEVGGKLFGRGSTDDKGPVLGWINAIETMQILGMEIPINIKFVFECMEESGSIGLEEMLFERQSFLKNVEYVCISDNYWLGTTKPCLTYGLRGISYFTAKVSHPATDLHSGLHGGLVHEPMDDLLWILNQVSKDGKPNFPGLNEMVAPVTPEEEDMYKNIDFSVDSYQKSTSANIRQKDKTDLLMNRWRYPSISVHGIEGAFSDAGAKTVIPSSVIGKFSIRTVPNMTPEKVETLVVDHLNTLWKQRNSPNDFKGVAFHSGKSWLTDPKGANFQAAAKAIKTVYGVDPDYTREGGSIPITITFQELSGVPVLLLPMGAADDNPHAQNEKIDVRNYVEGIKLLAAYIFELA
ncbi:unnamed protein product [Auanema sp. JU1783]|nr:unnamed protein product [Auanema sp. JU1783]